MNFFISKSSKIEVSPLAESTSMKIFFKNVFKDESFYNLKDKSFIKVDKFGMMTIYGLLWDIGCKIYREKFKEVQKWN